MKTSNLRGRVVSPSAPSVGNPDKVRNFEQGLAVMREMGFVLDEGVHTRNMHGYLAGTAEERAADMMAAYLDKDIDFIIAGIGGWNGNGILNYLDWDVIRNNPKPLVGFSDISVLQAALYAKTGDVQLHGPTVRWGMDHATPFTKQSLLRALNHEKQVIPMQRFGRFLKGSDMDGTMVVGNLVSLSVLLGTPYEIDWEGKILCWEETEETIYRLERVLDHFELAGVWGKIAGMVIGELDQIDETFNGVTTPVMEMILEHFSRYDFPIIKTELFGHSKGVDFMTMPTGGRISAYINSDVTVV